MSWIRSSQLERADDAGCACQLIKGEQTERVTHDDRDAASRLASGKSTMRYRERSQSEIRLRLAAACREEEQIHRLPIGMSLVNKAA
jgi:hypothetical protein